MNVNMTIYIASSVASHF